jgi:hypothetical protein
MKENASLDLFRSLLRCIKKQLPPNTSNYYRSYLKNQFRGHIDETDRERIACMHVMAKEKAEWILKKYKK